MENEKQSPNSTTILVLGILGIVLCGICAIIAWVMGNNEIKMYPKDQNIKTGRLLGKIGTILMIIYLPLYTLLKILARR